MKFQRCDRCGKEKPLDKGITGNYDTITFGEWQLPAETFDVCPECKTYLRKGFPLVKVSE